MIRKSKTKPIVLISFSVILLLLAALIVISIQSIYSNQQQVLQLKHESETQRHVSDMRGSAHSRVLLLYQMIIESDDFERDDMRIEYGGYAEKFIKSLELLQQSNLSVGIREYLDTALKSAGPGQKSQNEAMRLLFEDNDIASSYSQLRHEVMPIQKQVMTNLTKLMNATSVNVNNSIDTVFSENKQSILSIGVLGGAAFLLGIIITIFVSSRIVKTEEAFIEQKEIAESASNEKSLFLANMSHEIRSPLTAIIGFSDSILHRQLTEQKKEELSQRILRNSKHLHQIINDILDISKIESGQLELEIIPANVGMLMFEIESMVSQQIYEKNLKLNLNFAFPIPRTIHTDPTRLKQVLVNLINNATKFTEKGAITIDVAYKKDGDKLEIRVSDTGIGMTEEQAEKIFESFSQADTSTTRKFGGTGLGLSICKELSEKLGGGIECISTPGQGSTFIFDISTGEIDAAEMMYSKEELAHNSEDAHLYSSHRLQGHILLAEDTIDNQDLISMYVADTGADITIVDNGLLAVEKCQEGQYDLILMDMQMPVMDGIEATTKIRQSGVVTPVVFLTANAMKRDRDRCEAAGANDFLTKPLDESRFQAMLEKFLDMDADNVPEITTQSDSEIISKMPVQEIKPKKKSARMQQLIDRFVSELPERMENINHAFDSSSWDNLLVEIHKLKGLGTTMGFPEITECATDIHQKLIEKQYNQLSLPISSLYKIIGKIA